MAWTAPKTFTSSTVLTASDLNQQIRDNLKQCAAANFTPLGNYFVSTDPNQLAMRQYKKATSLASSQTTSTSYTDLPDGLGPSITIETGTEALVIYGCQLENDTAGFSAFMSITVTGNTSIAADTNVNSIRWMNNAGYAVQVSQFWYVDTLNAGENTFTAKYAVGGNTGTFSRRRMVVIPY
ncbi:hypothetical protein ACIRPT_02550 [Streptomyces sp. NPDC101227]|uniref:hypothetical protein n=1 Tax=Streptomyces sp. NPDC101227 TaxID=3366136 RepID=UPI003809BFA7